MFKYAITRKPGANFAQGITTADLGEPDYELMMQQYEAYIQALRDIGLEVIVLKPEPYLPDAYFVEDVAVVTRDMAVMTNPGAKARQGERFSLEPVLARYRPLLFINSPATVDGGDVLMVDRHFFIGISDRTNEAGVEKLGFYLNRHGKTWTAVPVTDGLHLKSSVNYVGKNTLLVTEAFANRPELEGYDKIILDEDEAYAANTLLVNDCLLMPKGFPNTRQKLAKLGHEIIELNVSEARKMDGGLTCMSLRF